MYLLLLLMNKTKQSLYHENLFKQKQSHFFTMNKWSELLLGLILLLGAIIIAWASSIYDWTLFGKSFDFAHAAWMFLKGGVFWLVLMVGLLLVVLGISDMKD